MSQLAYSYRCAGVRPPREQARRHPIAWEGFTSKTRGPLRRWTASAAILLMTLAAEGCAAQRIVVEDSTARAVSPTLAFVSLGPGAPRDLSVVESPYANATRQTIALATHGKTPGENQLRIDVFGLTNPNLAPDSSLPDLPLNEADLMAEAQDVLSDASLRISTNYMQNRYGPFGYAVGKSSQGDTCVYAWQRLETPEQKLSIVNSRNTISIRLRICDPKASEATLASLMMNLSVNVRLSGGSWTPDPRELSPTIGAAGAPMAPPQLTAAAVNPFPPASPVAATAPRAKRAIAVEPVSAPVIAPAPGVLVPPPPLALNNAPASSDAAHPPAPISVPAPPPEARP
jgi:hypothetical protein